MPETTPPTPSTKRGKGRPKVTPPDAQDFDLRCSPHEWQLVQSVLRLERGQAMRTEDLFRLAMLWQTIGREVVPIVAVAQVSADTRTT